MGLVVPPSEPDAASLVRGVQQAVADANDSGEGPVSLELKSEEGQWGTAGNEAATLVSERHVDAIISPSDGDTNHLILQVSGRTQTPVASLCPDSSVTDAGVIWAVRVVPRTDKEVAALFASASQPDHASPHWWAVAPEGRKGRAVRRDLARAARATSTPLDHVLDACPSMVDLVAQVQLIVDAAPGGVLIWLPPLRAGELAAALRAAGFKGLLAGPCPLDCPEFIAAAGNAAEGMRVANFRIEEESRAGGEEFRQRFLKRYGARPDFSATAAHDAASVLIETLRRSEKGAGDRLFPLVSPVPGRGGILHFDDLGNRTDALGVMACKQGSFIPLSSNDATL